MDLKTSIRSIPDWPIEGVIFRDLTTLMQNPVAYRNACDTFYNRYKNMPIDKIVGIDARGFVFGAVLAYQLNVGFVPVRKKGKLPYKTVSAQYTLEYGKNTVEMHADAITEGEKVVIIDDLIATGGTIEAAVKLVKKLGGDILECGFIVELPELKGREKIKDQKIFTICAFEGE
jgi:adenine phosphoribosyltransferase